ncbi:MAG: acyl-CoA thioesterase [Anaerolineales bacterium]|nr:acyl-CoA thioesterase [Anaerolineales bacterium]
MGEYRFFHSIEVRYGDIDAQRHVNNARHFTYMEQARTKYIKALGFWEGSDFDTIGIILAEQSCRYLSPIQLERDIKVGVRTVRLGEKSIETQYSIQDAQTGEELAVGWAILVAYDYQLGKSIPIPDDWRVVITAFEGI